MKDSYCCFKVSC